MPGKRQAGSNDVPKMLDASMKRASLPTNNGKTLSGQNSDAVRFLIPATLGSFLGCRTVELSPFPERLVQLTGLLIGRPAWSRQQGSLPPPQQPGIWSHVIRIWVGLGCCSQASPGAMQDQDTTQCLPRSFGRFKATRCESLIPICCDSRRMRSIEHTDSLQCAVRP